MNKTKIDWPEKMPEFDKPEMPPAEIRAGIDIATDNRHWVPADVPFFLYFTPYTRKDLSLPKDKVRELVRLHEEFRDLLLKYRFTPGVPDELNAKAEEIDNLQSALFPEGVERLTNGEE